MLNFNGVKFGIIHGIHFANNCSLNYVFFFFIYLSSSQFKCLLPKVYIYIYIYPRKQEFNNIHNIGTFLEVAVLFKKNNFTKNALYII